MKMDKRKRVYLGKHKNSNNYIFIDDIVREVDTFDKSFGLRLKHPEIFYDNESYADEMNKYANSVLCTLFARLNNIDPDVMCVDDPDDESYGDIADEETISYLISKYSKLKWNIDGATYDVSSLIFKMRFMSCIILSLLNNVKKISKRVIKKGKGYYQHSMDEQMYLLIPEIISRIVNCTRLMISGAQYRNDLIVVMLYMAYIKKKTKQPKLVEYVEYDMIPLLENIKPDLFSGVVFADDDIAIHSILGCGFVWATNNHKYHKVLPNFKYVQGATLKHDLSKLVESLGSAIINEKITDVYDAFITSDPKVRTEFANECARNRELTMGIYALEFVKFIFNDSNISKIVNSMTDKGL